MSRITLKDVAERAGVHPSTVSLALHQAKRIPEKTRQRIQAIADELHYQPNLLARGLATKRTRTIGIVSGGFQDSYYMRLLAQQHQWLTARNYSVLLAATEYTRESERRAFEQLLSRGVEGLITHYLPRYPETLAFLEQLKRGGFPIVLIGSGDRIDGFDQVHADIEQATYAVATHLLQLGHRRIALTAYGERESGYTRALRDADQSADPQLIVHFERPEAQAAQLVSELLSLTEPPTALIAHNDDLAWRLVEAFEEAGRAVPQDVSVAGINDDWYSSKLKTALTTYRLPTDELARRTIQLLIERVEGAATEPRGVTLKGELIIRDSTAPPPPARINTVAAENYSAIG